MTRRLLQRLKRDRSGVAAVEFAMSLPIILGVGLAGIETAHYALAHLRVSNIAVITADNAARVRETIDESDLNELFLGAEIAGGSVEFKENGRVILTDLEASGALGTVQWVRWQRCFGDRTDFTPAYGRPLDDDGDPIVDGTETFNADRKTKSSNPSSPDESELNAYGPAGRQIAAQPSTAVMVAEAIYEYQPIVPGTFLEGHVIRYTSAFNVRQRNDHTLRNGAAVTPKSCG